MDELWEQTKNIYANQNIEKKKFTKQIAFNVIPQIGSFLENGDTKEEEKMINETKNYLIQIFVYPQLVFVFLFLLVTLNQSTWN